MGGRDRIAHLLSTWPDDVVDNTEKCRRLIDLFLVSVLLDAGAGTTWSFKSADSGKIYRRSEGLAIASLEMFKAVRLLPQHIHASKFGLRILRTGNATLCRVKDAEGAQKRQLAYNLQAIWC